MHSDGLVKLPAPFEDARGWIQNVVEEPVGGASIIFSKACTTRSNHMHREDYHWLYVVSGEMNYESWTDEDSGTSCLVVQAGQCVFTPPGVWHRTMFPVDTVLLSVSRLPRDHATHEADLVRFS